MNNVQLDIPHARVIVRIQRGNTRTVLALTRQLHADKVHKLKRVASPVSRIRHGGDDVAFLASPAQSRRIVIYHAAHAVHNRQK